ncbi:hypothetical protein ACLOJK_025859 [Asimina triloba]
MEGSSNPNSFPQLDDLYAALFDGQASDEKFAEELQLQEVIFSSILATQPHPSARTTTPSSSKTETTPAKPEIALEEVMTAASEPSSSRRSFCEICMEEKAGQEMFENGDCSHVHCSDCISRHIAAKIQENVAMVRCPGLECKGLLAPDLCRPLLPAQVMERWEAALAEAMVLGSQRLYCPFKDCSALLVVDDGGAVRESECPNCNRLFCAQCMVAWHPGVKCEEFWALNEDEKGREDLMVLELAKTKRWSRCPRCRYYVETTGGCPHMVCRCQFEFCYRCGSAWSDVHGGSCEATGDDQGQMPTIRILMKLVAGGWLLAATNFEDVN